MDFNDLTIIHEHLNKETCNTCINWIRQTKNAGHCKDPRLNDINRRYVNSLQPDSRYNPKIIFQTSAKFGCVHHLKIPFNEQE